MFSYSVNWLKIIKENLPQALHKTKRINMLEALFKPLRVLHAQFILMVDEYSQKARFTNEKQYIEKALNLKFDPTNGIFITLTVPKRTYVFKTEELQADLFVFNEWKAVTPYTVGQYAQEDLGVYKCKIAHSGLLPSANPSHWDVELFATQVVILRQESEFSPATRFTVMVPNYIAYDEQEMRAVIDLYNLAGIDYLITTY
jgi:hypothetical protein